MMPAFRYANVKALRDLLAGIIELPARFDRPIDSLAVDSREVQPGSLFFARAGLNYDGNAFTAAAVENGAVAVVREGTAGVDVVRGRAVVVSVPDIRCCMGLVADAFFEHPSRALRVVGVTGTNGKTSVSHFIAQALAGEGRLPGVAPSGPCGVIGTLGHGLHRSLRPSAHTTPHAVMNHALLASMRDAGARFAVMEVSSHALDQRRVEAVAFDTAVFTNLSRDHLDYHRTRASYGAAKKKLFEVAGLRNAVINADDRFGRALLGDTVVNGAVFSYGFGARAETVRGHLVASGPEGCAVQVDTPWGQQELFVPLLGRFNASNALGALTALLALGMDLDTAVQRLAALEGLPGRMERVEGEPGTPQVVVDYAHSPEALTAALQALRQHTAGSLWCVVGCGGDRDRGKRPLMGRAAATGADAVILTDDNPRCEDPAGIMGGILRGIPAGRTVFVEHDRATAIKQAVAGADAGDIVLIAGKGHETYQDIQGVRRPFSDVAAARAALRERGT